MKNRNTNTQKQMSLALVAFNLLAMVALNCQPAQAIVSDPGYIDQLQNRKRALQTREFYLMRDTDDLLKRKEDLKQKTDSDSVWQLNEVCRKIDLKSWDLQQVRLDIRDVNLRLL
jgi:hypothetical protein